MRQQDDIDRMIEEALRSEPMRPVPPGFHRRLEESLRVVALVEQERRTFRNRCLVVVGLFMTLVATVSGWSLLSEVPRTVLSSVPGAWGQIDRTMSYVALYWPGLLAAAVGGGCLLVLAIVISEAGPVRLMRAVTR